MASEPETVQDEIYDFLVSQMSPEAIVAFRPSEKAQARLRDLLDANRTRELTSEENAELDEYTRVEHFMIMLKAKARQRLAQS